MVNKAKDMMNANIKRSLDCLLANVMCLRAWSLFLHSTMSSLLRFALEIKSKLHKPTSPHLQWVLSPFQYTMASSHRYYSNRHHAHALQTIVLIVLMANTKLVQEGLGTPPPVWKYGRIGTRADSLPPGASTKQQLWHKPADSALGYKVDTVMSLMLM